MPGACGRQRPALCVGHVRIAGGTLTASVVTTSNMAKRTSIAQTTADWLLDILLRAIITTMMALPYRTRVAVTGQLMQKVIGPVAGYSRRCMQNLAFIYPDMPMRERRVICRGALNNAGRTFIENYSTGDLLRRQQDAPLTGDGVAPLYAARKKGQAVILVSGHFGNYEAARAALVGHGFSIGGLYRRAANRFFNAHYARNMQAFGGPVFEQGPRGTTGFVRHLKTGGMLVLLFDQHVQEGETLPFIGQPAKTAISAAQLAMRYDALLIPFFAVRKSDGLTFDIQLDAPVAVTDPKTMTRALNASLEKRIADHPEQWFWVHRRWKVGRGSVT